MPAKLNGKQIMKEIPDSDFVIKADLVLLAMGFIHCVHEGIVKDFGLKLDVRGNIEVNEQFMTSRKNIFAAGDSHRGASLVVWAIHEGREAAKAIDCYLMDNENL